MQPLVDKVGWGRGVSGCCYLAGAEVSGGAYHGLKVTESHPHAPGSGKELVLGFCSDVGWGREGLPGPQVHLELLESP